MKVVRGALVQFMAAFVGLLCYLVLASLIGWIEPIWWGGKSLFPALIGVLTLLIGALPFHVITAICLRRIAGLHTFSNQRLIIVGAIQGVVFSPFLYLVAALAAAAPLHAFPVLGGWINPLDALIVIFVIVGITATLFAAIIVSLLVRWRGEKDQE